MSISSRPRRNRRTAAIRQLVCETQLRPQDLVMPAFVVDGKAADSPIKQMPGISRVSLDRLLRQVEEALSLGIRAVALFPCISENLKDHKATESENREGLIPRVVRSLKQRFPELVVVTDVAMDPYSSDGHDGLVKSGRVLNDETLPILARMASVQAEAGADYVAPSDMMDGRVAFIREALDENGHSETGILSYAVKYASAFYGPFRDALDSAPRHGNKKTYQMDPGNQREALRELLLDVEEGADIVMVKPAGPYLDIVALARELTNLPIAAYQVSGEYAMIKFAAAANALSERDAALESLIAIKRAGANLIFSYFTLSVARWLKEAEVGQDK